MIEFSAARFVTLLGLLMTSGVPSGAETPPDDGKRGPAPLSARKAVRVGNDHLRASRPEKALEAYKHAESLEPSAPEIAFVEGLAQFDLKEFDKARDAFRRAAGIATDRLAVDSLYSLGATDHAEALSVLETDPKLALSKLEDGMRRYHDVLAQQPDHQAARDANLRAASMWRKLKRRMGQQQQNQDQNQQQQGEEQERQDGDERQQKQEQQDQSQEPQEQQDEQQQQEQQSTPDKPAESEQQGSQTQKQEQVSREQAERRLREMMQAIRDRKKTRREPTRNVPIAPVEKDW